MCYLQCITKKYGGFLLETAATKCGFKGATLHRLMKVKGDYRQSLNFILTVNEALMLHQIKSFIDHINLDQCDENLRLGYQTLKDINWDQEKTNDFLDICKEGLKPFSEKFYSFLTKLSEKSENYRLINSFVWEDCSALLQLLSSIQSGDIEERDIAMKRMIPLFFAMDR